MSVRSVAVAAVLALAGGLGFAPDSTAHTGAAFCEGNFENVPYGALTNGTRPGAGEGSCETSFQGFPLGVIGVYEAVDSDGVIHGDAPAEVHIEVWLTLASGTKRKYAECEDGISPARFGTAECSFENKGETGAHTLSEPLPSEIVGVSCVGHTHARVKDGTQPIARMGCYSTNEAEAALRSDMELPPAGPGPDPEPAPIELPGATPDGPFTAITSVPPNLYFPSTAVATSVSDVWFVNMDIGVRHDVVALDALRAEGSAPWCADVRFAGGCPLFWTGLITGGVGATARVEGLEGAPPGAYSFYCTIHPEMVGTLQLVGI